MRVLAIETSCDETGVAILEGKLEGDSFVFEVLGNALLSQASLHSPYGGVFPMLAKREHEKNLPIILEQAVQKASHNQTTSNSSVPSLRGSRSNPKVTRNSLDCDAKPRNDDQIKSSDGSSEELLIQLSNLRLDAIAVTYGPGLEPALWTGITFAQQLARETLVPLMGINHMEGHIISSLTQKYTLKDIQFPVLALLISGGHTEFVLVRDWFVYEMVGQTLDDAVGEAFDKVARMLDLPYPGGPEISKLADAARSKSRGSSILQRPLEDLQRKNTTSVALEDTSINLPRPMLSTKNCDMSFSGLKTAALYAVRDLTAKGERQLSEDEKAAFAREFEDAVGDVFVTKTHKALLETGAKTFVIGGGVAANRYIRERLQTLVLEDFDDVEFRLPELAITGDNAIMIGEAALVHILKNGLPTNSGEDIKAVGNLSLNSQK